MVTVFIQAGQQVLKKSVVFFWIALLVSDFTHFHPAPVFCIKQLMWWRLCGKGFQMNLVAVFRAAIPFSAQAFMQSQITQRITGTKGDWGIHYHQLVGADLRLLLDLWQGDGILA